MALPLSIYLHLKSVIIVVYCWFSTITGCIVSLIEQSWLSDKHGHVVCHHLWMVLLGVVLYELQACLYVYFILLHAIQLSF